MLNRKKIIIITNLFPTEWDKQRGMFNYQQFSQLANYYDLVILMPIPFLEYHRNAKHDSYFIRENIEVRYVSFYYIPGILRFSHGISLYASMRPLFKKIKGEAFDLVIGSWVFPDGYVAIKLAKYLKRPCIIKVHGSDINVFTKTMIRRWLIQYTLNTADFIVSVSNDLKLKMMELNSSANKIQVIYNGLNKELFCYKDRVITRKLLNIEPNKFVFLFVGNIKISKGIAELLSSFRNFLTHYDAALYVIGGGERMQWLTDKVREYGLHESIIVSGQHDLSTISQYMSAANVLVLPSYNEGVPNVLLEAKGCGLPVVATSVGGIPEITNRHDCILIEKQSEESLLNGMLEAYSKDWDQSVIVEQSLQYSWKENGDMFNQVIKNVS